MCGIYGSTIRYSDEVLKAKLNIIKFRGPDFSSFERNDDIIWDITGWQSLILTLALTNRFPISILK